MYATVFDRDLLTVAAISSWGLQGHKLQPRPGHPLDYSYCSYPRHIPRSFSAACQSFCEQPLDKEYFYVPVKMRSIFQ